MRTVGRLVTGAVAVVAAIGATVAGVGARADTAEEDAAAVPEILSDFGACLVGEQHGDIVLLMDQSSSLEQTDADLDRVTAASYLVDRLEAFSTSSGIEVDVVVASFAADYATATEWMTVSTDTTEAIQGAVANLAETSVRIDTDYWNALEGARQTLAEKASDQEGRSCQAIAWFTDGRHEINVRTTAEEEAAYGTEKSYAPAVPLTTVIGVEEAERAGADDLCRPTGLADQLRSSGVTLFGIGLTRGGASDDHLDVMRSIVTGSTTGGVDCGEVPAPLGRFFTADNLDELLLAFDEIATPGQPPQVSVSGICQGQVCSEHARSFVLDASIADVHVLAAALSEDGAALPEVQAVLIPPGGTEPWLIEPAAPGEVVTTGSAGGAATYTWLSPGAFELDLHAADNDAWAGQWQLVFVDPTRQSEGDEVTVNLHLSSNIVTRWPEALPQTPRTGEPLAGVELVMSDIVSREVIDPETLLGDVSVDAQLVDAAGAVFPVFEDASASDLAGPVSVDLAGAAPGTATVTVSTVITTAEAVLADGSVVPGTTLAPRESSVPVVLEPPVNFPSVASSVDFGTLDGDTTASAGLPITGPGCVWLGSGPSLSGAPAMAGEVTVTADAQDAEGCLVVAEGTTTNLDLTLATEQAANGAVVGTVEVVTAPLNELDQQVSVVTFQADLRKPLNPGPAVAAFVVALVLGVGIPVTLLYLAKWYTARIPGRQLLVGTALAKIPPDGGRAQLSLADRDLSLVPMPRKGRKAITEGPYVLRARMSLSPTESGHVELVGSNAPSVSSATPGRRGSVARLPLAVHQHWLAILDQPDSPQTVTVVFLVGGISGPEERANLLDDARDRLPDVVGQLDADVALERASDTAGPATVAAGSARTVDRDQEPDERAGTDDVWGDWR